MITCHILMMVISDYFLYIVLPIVGRLLTDSLLSLLL